MTTKFVGADGLTELIAQIKKGLNAKANSATQLSGYGITDAKIANGTITLGSNTITPLTSYNISTAANATGYIADSTSSTVDGNKVVDVKTLKTITDTCVKTENVQQYFNTNRVDFSVNDWTLEDEVYTITTDKSYILDVYMMAEDGKYHNTVTSIYKNNTCTLVSATAFEGFYTYSQTVTLETRVDADGDDINDKYATNTYVASSLNNKANSSDVYTKEETDGLVTSLSDSEINTAILAAESK